LYSSQYRQHLSPTYVFELEKSEIRKSEKRLLFTLDGEGDGKSAVFAVPNYFLEYREHFLPNFFSSDEKEGNRQIMGDFSQQGEEGEGE